MDILIAEDDSTTLKLLMGLLRAMGHAPVGVEDGVRALERFEERPFPVVITDWNMPGMDGLELARRIRQMKRNQYTWIIMLTARDFAQNHAYAIEVGVDDYLVKPLDPDLLGVRLHVAERIHGMVAHIQALESCMPICMYCKDIRDTKDQWTKIESFLADSEGMRFTHGLCPRCYYARVLRADLDDFKREYPPAATVEARAFDGDLEFDAPLHEALARYARDRAPSLIEELNGSFSGAVRDIRRVLDATRDDKGMLARSAARFSLLCVDLGMFGLARHLNPEAVEALDPRDAAAVAGIHAALDRAEAALAGMSS